ncbi:MAG: ComF family protein [Clostridia bacterium]
MKLLANFIDWLYPRNLVCAICGLETLVGMDGLCEGCRAQLTIHPSCECPAQLDGLICGLAYTEAVESPMHRFKYQRQIALASFFAQFIELPDSWKFDCMIPVPLHPLRQWVRTFNQSQALCAELQQRYQRPVCTHLLLRTRYTKPQAQLDAAHRSFNLTAAFSASKNVSGRSVLLVDDVATTQATLITCADALKQAGAKHVYGACACLAGVPKQNSALPLSASEQCK